MMAQPPAALKIPNTTAILQLNCRRSHSTLNSLFNDTNVSNFIFIAVQEPPINSHTSKPPEHSGWYLIVTQPPDNTEPSRPRLCLYVNSALDADVRPITSASRDVSACVVKIQDLDLLLVNVYNQPRTFKGFEAMGRLLLSLPHSTLRLPTVIVTDSNLHSTLWNPERYTTHDLAANNLVEEMTKWDLFLRSPKG